MKLNHFLMLEAFKARDWNSAADILRREFNLRSVDFRLSAHADEMNIPEIIFEDTVHGMRFSWREALGFEKKRSHTLRIHPHIIVFYVP